MRSILKRYKVLVENFFSLSVLNGLNALLPLIILKYLSKTITEAQYGSYYYIYTLIQILILISNYGFNFSATKLISENRYNRNLVNRIFNAVIVSKAVLATISVITVLVFSKWLLDSPSLILMFLLGLGMLIGDIVTPTWLFQGMEKMKYMTIVNSLSKIIFTLLVFVFVKGQEDYTRLLLLNSCGYIMAGALSVLLVYREFNLRFARVNLSDIKFQLKEGATVFGSTMGINLYRRANVVILKHFVPENVLGVYSIAEQSVRGIQSLINPVVQVLFPHLSLKFKGKSYQDNIALLRKIAIPFASILTVAFGVCFYFAPLIIRIMSDITLYSGSISLFRWLSPVIIFGEMNYLLGIVGLINMNRQSRFLMAVLISGITSVLFLFVLVPFIGATAAAISMSIAEIILFIICIIELKKKDKK